MYASRRARARARRAPWRRALECVDARADGAFAVRERDDARAVGTTRGRRDFVDFGERWDMYE